MLIYFVGYKGARSFIGRYGKYVFMNQHHLDKAEHWFSRYGEWTAFIARNIPFIRTFISLPAGMARMNFAKFSIYTFLGCIPWNFGLAYLGFKLSEHWQMVETYVRPISYAVLSIIILLIVRFVYKAIKGYRKEGMI
jgi:membrane protein DedA with SNARE-associated domain